MFRQFLLSFLILPTFQVCANNYHAKLIVTLHDGTVKTNPSGSSSILVDQSSNKNFVTIRAKEDYVSPYDCGSYARLKTSGTACSVEDSWDTGSAKGCFTDAEVTKSGLYIPATALGVCTVEYYASESGSGGSGNEKSFKEIFTIAIHEHWQGPPANTQEGDTYTISYAEKNKAGVDAYDIAYNSQTGAICRVEADGSVTNLADGECRVDIIATSRNAAYASKTVTKTWNIIPDTDLDGIKDSADNCPSVPNADQADYDKDGVGDKCNDALDEDGDEIADARDLCPKLHLIDDPLAATTDATYGTFLNHADAEAPFGAGDSCQTNSDGDSHLDYEDNCPTVDNEDQEDLDGNGVGDACEFNSDGDSHIDLFDNCPLVDNEDQADTDNDGIGEACEPDSDNDGVKDAVLGERDNCPYVANPDQEDDNRNGVGDVCEMTFVDPAGVSAANDCLSWGEACSSIQKAIDVAVAEGLPQVFIKAGTYQPTSVIALAEGVKLIGGFAGDELAANEANPFNNVTTISAGTYKGTLINVSGTAPLSYVDTAEIRGLTISGAEDSAVKINDATVNIVNVKFDGNSAVNGAAINASGSPKAEIDLNGVTFTNNTSTNGAVYLNNADLSSVKTTYTGNQGTNGVAIFATGTSVVSLDKTDVIQNTATGNGVLASDSQHVELKVANSTLSENSAAFGGAIYLNDAKELTLRNMLITNNHASNGAGGAVMFAGTNNTVTALISQSSIMGNTATKNGGAIAPGVGSSLLIENVTFANNKAGVDADGSANGFSSRGGAINVGGAATTITIRYSTFVGNAAEGSAKGGGAIAMNNNLSGSVSMMANLLAGNTGANGANIFVDNVGGSKTINDLGYNYVGFNNVSGLSPANALNLAASSTVMQAADLTSIVATTPTNSGGDGYGSPLPMLPLKEDSEARNVIDDGNCATTVDQRGEARPDAAKCDIGAYEYTELSCIDDARRRQAAGEGLVKYCAPGFEEIEFTIGQVHYYVLILLSLLGLGLAVRRK